MSVGTRYIPDGLGANGGVAAGVLEVTRHQIPQPEEWISHHPPQYGASLGSLRNSRSAATGV